MSALHLGLRLLLVALLLDGSLAWPGRIPLMALSGAALVFPALLLSRWIWAGLLLVTGASLASAYPLPDNHDYLTLLACLAVLCALHTRDPAASLATSARLLVGLAFGFALLWKLGLSPEYRDGRFFRVTLLTDARFQDLAALAGGLGWERWEANVDALQATLAGRAPWPEGGLDEPAALRRLAGLATLSTALLEAWVALGFLLPRRPRPRWLQRLGDTRDLGLLLFALTTYAFAPVRGFAWLLLALGAAQCERPRLRLAYAAGFLLVEVYRSVPWSEALVLALGRS